MFDLGVGKNIADGAIKQIQLRFFQADPNTVVIDIGRQLQRIDFQAAAKKAPIIGDIARVYTGMRAGYDKMTPEEQAEFWKNVLITGAKLGAKFA